LWQYCLCVTSEILLENSVLEHDFGVVALTSVGEEGSLGTIWILIFDRAIIVRLCYAIRKLE
jgi:hypothetical protein